MTAPDDAVKAVTALQFGGPWDPWGLTPDEARTVIAAAMPHIRAQIAGDIASMEASGEDRYALGFRAAVKYAAFLARGES